ncbi:MAG: class I SAM-dependent RNA methyltransferase [Acidobacteriota bacterium]
MLNRANSYPTVMARGETNGAFEVLIEKLVYGGRGLGRLEGRVVLVPLVLPGETVRVQVERERRGLLEARLLEVVSPAPARVQPPCPYFGRCGGCQYQHAACEFELEAKREILRETFERVGKLAPPGEIAAVAGPPWEYRNRTGFHIERGRIGYFESGSHRLCPVDRCLICSPKINETLAALRAGRLPRAESVEVFTNETDVQMNVPAAAGALDYAAAGETYRVGPRSFFQTNRFLLDEMVRCALEGAAGETALDLYAGVGLFSLPLARRIGSVTAVESGAAAARDLEFNAARAGLPVEVKHSPVEMFLAALAGTPDFVLADPPRAGLGPRVAGELLRLGPPRLAIVSCDPATLARDLAPLAAGGYRLERLTLIDLFPRTYHIETVAQLRAGDR